MSSHHFVVDSQEGALIIGNGQHCSQKLLQELLEWERLIVALDEAALYLFEQNIQPDIIIGDFDKNRSYEKILEKSLSVNATIVKDNDVETTDLEKALNYLLNKGILDVHLVNITGKRADHNLNNLFIITKFMNKMRLQVFDDYSIIYAPYKKFKKFYTKNTKLSLMPIGMVEGVVTQNLFYSLNNEDLDSLGRSGSSNCVKEDGVVEINYKKGRLLIMECFDDENYRE